MPSGIVAQGASRRHGLTCRPSVRSVPFARDINCPSRWRELLVDGALEAVHFGRDQLEAPVHDPVDVLRVELLGCDIGSWGFLEGRCLRMADYVRGPEATRAGPLPQHRLSLFYC